MPEQEFKDMKSQLFLALGTVNSLIYKYLEGKPEVPWDSLVINRRKPHTYRAFCYPKGDLEGIRICLHRFEPCSDDEAFLHPHPWPSAMRIFKGQYRMRVGCSAIDPQTKRPDGGPTMVMDTILAAGSSYVMEEPSAWHSVQPLTTCWSVMVNGAPWGDKAHPAAPTTKGKDLEKMSHDGLDEHLRTFQQMLADAMVDGPDIHAKVLAALDKRGGSAPALEVAALADLSTPEIEAALREMSERGLVRLINDKKPLYEQVVVRRRG